jgi:hypothetical protein
MSALLAPALCYRDFTNGGEPLAFGLVYTYAAGTTTPQATYVDNTQTTQNPNPVVLNARGEASIWTNPALSYKFVVTDSNGNTIRTVDNVVGFNILVSALISGNFTQAALGAILYPQTAAEIAATITPANYAYPELDFRRYQGWNGNGTASDFNAVNSAFLVAQQYTGSTLRAPQNSTIVLNAPLTNWDVAKFGIDWNGSTVLWSGMTTANSIAIAPFTSQSDSNRIPAYAAPHRMSNARLVGPGMSYTSIIGISLSDANPTPNMSGCLFSGITSVDFAVDVAFGNGAFCDTFENCIFTTFSGVGTTYSVVMESGATNAGEKLAFTKCFWYNKAYAIDNQSDAADMYFDTCSFDGCVTIFSNTGGSYIDSVSGHYESSTAGTAAWFYNSGTNSAITIKGGTIVMDAGISGSFPIGQCNSSVGGIFMDDVKMGFGANSYTASDGVFGPVLIGGTGRARVRNPVWGQGTPIKPGLSAALNALAYPGFESASYTDEWTLTNAVRSTTVAHSGTYSLALNAASSVNATAITSPACAPGQWATGSIWYQWPGSVSGTLQLSLSFCDANGTAISGASSAFLTATSAVGTWTNVTFPAAGTPTPAPNGTVSAKLTLTVFGAAGTSVAYVDDILLTVA